ncbi:uncharacterized protein VICG_00175 [Vittaforma corneae ATCC 50505]|uniref:ABC transporter domain-containing protein n=1 Tax=Vittaforma corneae (strain ATCC 50505) TaxID=993615 RepID=L2GQR6_VITCO|nr:uncharacterized protein VICG_00175 [Vittaforma corneae ATCC 50505]ELA42860.1 hypothetical protein VICG_00175 [Vittaforma corneae ATCC 50505]
MKLANVKDLLKEVLAAFVCENRYYKSVGMALSFIFNVLSTLFYLTSLELLRNIIKIGDATNRPSLIYRYIAHAAVGILFRCLCKMFFGYFSEKSIRDLMVRFLKDAMSVEYKDIVRSDSGEIITNIHAKLVVYKSLFEMLAFKLVSIMMFIVFSFIKIRSSNQPLLYFLTLIYPVAYLLISIIKLKPILKFHTSYLNEKVGNSSILYDKIQNFELIKAYGIEEKQSGELYVKTSKQRKDYFRMKLEGEKRNLLVESFSELPFVAAILLVSLAFSTEAVNLSVIFMVFKSLNALLKQASDLISSLAISLNGIEEIFDVPVETKTRKTLVFSNCICFKSINIYQDKTLILENINLKIQKNDKIAVVGRNGTGKSTFLKTLLRFSSYDGEITIDGQSINSISNSSLFDLIAYVSQDDYISDATILDNVRMGSKHSRIDEITCMATLLGIHSEIVSLKNGYNTHSGFNGSNLSAGQKKKICILRAFVKNSPILVLDEATSTVDKKYEDYFIKHVLKEITNKTILMIIHQKELVKYFEKVAFLKDGKVEEYGRFDEIYRKSKAFREFMNEKCQ